jgi:hypothetical protein
MARIFRSQKRKAPFVKAEELKTNITPIPGKYL